MKIKRFLFIFFISILTFSCSDELSKLTFPLETPDDITDEDYLIYSLVIDELYNSSSIVIKQKTGITFNETDFSEYLYEYFENSENAKNISSETLSNYYSLNQTPFYFDNKFSCKNKEVLLISNEELNAIFNENTSEDIDKSWEKYYSKYDKSNGFMSFTKIGYNNSKTQAIFEIHHSYESLGASTSIIYLEKEGENWVLKDTLIYLTS